MRKLLAGLVLAASMCVPAWAGDTDTPGYVPPPPPVVEGDTDTPGSTAPSALDWLLSFFGID